MYRTPIICIDIKFLLLLPPPPPPLGSFRRVCRSARLAKEETLALQGADKTLLNRAPRLPLRPSWLPTNQSPSKSQETHTALTPHRPVRRTVPRRGLREVHGVSVARPLAARPGRRWGWVLAGAVRPAPGAGWAVLSVERTADGGRLAGRRGRNRPGVWLGCALPCSARRGGVVRRGRRTRPLAISQEESTFKVTQLFFQSHAQQGASRCDNTFAYYSPSHTVAPPTSATMTMAADFGRRRETTRYVSSSCAQLITFPRSAACNPRRCIPPTDEARC